MPAAAVHLRRLGQVVSRPRLTPHQRDTLADLIRHSGTQRRPVPEGNVGSVGALEHLEDKGYARIDHIEYGPRGGRLRYWIPTAEGRMAAQP